MVLARNDWLGNISVDKGQHLEILEDDRLRWWTVKNKEKGTTGFILSSVFSVGPDPLGLEESILRTPRAAHFYKNTPQ